MLFHDVPRVSMALSSPLAMLNTQRPAGERAKRSKLANEMVRWVHPIAPGRPCTLRERPISGRLNNCVNFT